MNAPVPFYTEADVVKNLQLSAVIDTLESALARECDGTATNIPKTMAVFGQASSAHALGAVDLGTSLVAFKTWVNTPSGAAAVATVFDATDGHLRAVVQAGMLGALRTAAVSGVATRWLAAPGADELAIVGAGRQALPQVMAVHAVRPLRAVRVWSRDPQRRRALADQITQTISVPATAPDTLTEALAGAPIVTLVTRAAEPFLTAADLDRGAHLNAVGAILPTNAEFDPALLGGAQLTVVDNLDNAKRSSRELREFYAEDWSQVRTLADVVTGAVKRDDSDPRWTVFKPLGMGLADLAALEAFLRVVDPEHAEQQ
jgi:alanine dehydrogenase